MPYVPGFTNDIFISYAHDDNDRHRWVERFQADLESRLKQVIGERVAIWRDSRLRGTDVFSPELLTQLESSALLISIVSPSGIHSDWCQKEWQKFGEYAEMNGGFQIGNLLRAIKVVKTPLDSDHHRDLLGVVTGFEFYQWEPQTNRFREFDLDSREFERTLDYLAQDVKEVLNALRNRLDPESRRPTVYVATTTEDIDEQRRSIVRQIEDWGYSVAPASPFILHNSSSSSFRLITNSLLSRSILSVHLVSHQRGPTLGAEAKSVIALQYEFAQSRPVDRVVWVLPGRHRDEVVQDSIDQGLQKGVEILEGHTVEDLKDVIEAKLNLLRGDPTRQQKGEERLSVYVVCDHKARPFLRESECADAALKLQSYLDSRGLVVWLPPVGQNEEMQSSADHHKPQQHVNAVLIYGGTVKEISRHELVPRLVDDFEPEPLDALLKRVRESYRQFPP